MNLPSLLIEVSTMLFTPMFYKGSSYQLRCTLSGFQDTSVTTFRSSFLSSTGMSMNLQILSKIGANMTLQQVGKTLENVTLHLQ